MEGRTTQDLVSMIEQERRVIMTEDGPRVIDERR